MNANLFVVRFAISPQPLLDFFLFGCGIDWLGTAKDGSAAFVFERGLDSFRRRVGRLGSRLQVELLSFGLLRRCGF